MSWETRGNEKNRYYYTGQRVDGKVVKTYHGRAQQAQLAAYTDAMNRATKAADHEAARDMTEGLAPVNQLCFDLSVKIDELVEAALLVNGYHEHHGQWRKRHGSHTRTA